VSETHDGLLNGISYLISGLFNKTVISSGCIEADVRIIRKSWIDLCLIWGNIQGRGWGGANVADLPGDGIQGAAK